MDDSFNTPDSAPNIPLRSPKWFPSLHYPFWTLIALMTGVTLYLYLEFKKPQVIPEVEINCPSSRDPQLLQKPDFSLTCTVKMTQGEEDATACWIAVYTCKDGRKVKAVPCVDVGPDRPESITLIKEKDFPGWENCVATGFEVFLFKPEDIEEE